MFVLLYLVADVIKRLESRILSSLAEKMPWFPFLSTFAFYAATFAILCLSVFETMNQRDFVNDWPAHLHHVEQWLEGTTNYAHFMHYHGPCTYPAGFMLFYILMQVE